MADKQHSAVGTVAQALQWAVAQLSESSSPKLDAEVLLAKVLAKQRSYLFTWPEAELTAAQQQQFSAWVMQRQAGQPMAYLLGEREFWSLPLATNPSTLIPRADTECLVEFVLSLTLPATAHVLDLGTGTGAIALALASERKHWHIQGIDKEAAAIALASANATRLQLPVSFSRSDWFSAITNQGFDLIVSNPPYIDANDVHLQQGDLRFEPRSALVAADAGLADLAAIVAQAPSYLKPRGWLVVEHGWQQAAAVRQLMVQQGFTAVASGCDYGGNERYTYGQCVGQTTEEASNE
ncbi:peptide chain release factor N(5)-glutamine methyltransferase [Pseudidiomarina sp. PP-1MA]|uniref:Release factor glutamine methyltransferase n=1 Tax=Pseudidiomarina sp. PP-1MA TaxID=3237706 RepID=A0AB39XCB7_9GAMM